METLATPNPPQPSNKKKKLMTYTVIGVIFVGFILFIALYRSSSYIDYANTHNNHIEAGDFVFYGVSLNPKDYFIVEWTASANLYVYLVDDCGLMAYFYGNDQFFEIIHIDNGIREYHYEDYIDVVCQINYDQYNLILIFEAVVDTNLQCTFTEYIYQERNIFGRLMN